jgi:hypothetical protein
VAEAQRSARRGSPLGQALVLAGVALLLGLVLGEIRLRLVELPMTLAALRNVEVGIRELDEDAGYVMRPHFVGRLGTQDFDQPILGNSRGLRAAALVARRQRPGRPGPQVTSSAPRSGWIKRVVRSYPTATVGVAASGAVPCPPGQGACRATAHRPSPWTRMPTPPTRSSHTAMRVARSSPDST